MQRLGELEGIVGDHGCYTAETDAATLLQGLGHRGSPAERKDVGIADGQKVRRAVSTSPLRQCKRAGS